MGVKGDAGELLLFFYDELVKKGKNGVGTKDVLDASEWDGNRLNNAYHYLNDLGILKGIGSLGNIQGAHNFWVMRLLPDAIDIIEDQPEFKRNFGFEVNLGLFKFSWGASER